MVTSAVTSQLQNTTQSSPKSPSSPLSPPPSDEHDTHCHQVFNTLFGNNEPQFTNKSPTPFIAACLSSPPQPCHHLRHYHHILQAMTNTSFTADIILPEENDLVRAEDIDDDEITESFDSTGTTTPLAGIVSSSNTSSNNKMLFRRTAEEYMSNR